MSKEQIDGFVGKLKQFLNDRGAQVIKVAGVGAQYPGLRDQEEKKGLLHPALPERRGCDCR